MSIDRNIAYYLNFKNKRGWDMRLEIIPAGEAKDPSTFAWNELKSSVLNIEGAKFDFEDLPLGIMQAPTLNIQIDLRNNNDSNLAELLQQPHYTTAGGVITSTIFTLATNYGNGALDKFVFVGGQSLELGNEITIDHNYNLISITIQSIDIVKLIMESTRTEEFCLWMVSNLVRVSGITVPQIIRQYGADPGLVLNSEFFKNHIDNSSALHFEDDDCSYYKLIDIFGQAGLGEFLESRLNTWLRRTGIGTNKNLVLHNSVLKVITFRRQGFSFSNLAGSDLAEDEVLIIGKISIENDNNEVVNIGLFYPDSGDETFLSAEYLHELVSDIAETFCVKFKWQAVTDDGSTNNTINGYYVPMFSVGWYRPFEPSLHGSYYNLNLLKIITKDGTFNADTTSNVFRSAECEIPNVSGDNIQNIKKDLSGIAGKQTWSVKMALYSMPTHHTYYNKDQKFLTEQRLYLRKMFYVYSGHCYLLHGSCKINDGYHSIYELDTPVPFTDVNTLSSDVVEAMAKGWVLQTQRTNSVPVAITNWVVNTFSSANITKRTITLEIDGEKLTAWSIGDGFILPAISGSAASTNHILMSMEINWIEGTADCEFVSIAP